jgi:predicted RNase H-like HicB family nuclease
MRQALVYHGENGFWIAAVPSLPGCVSQGKTREQAVENIREAIELHIEALHAHRREVPPDSLDALLIAV